MERDRRQWNGGVDGMRELLELAAEREQESEQ